MRIDELITYAADSALDAERAAVRAARFRAAAIAEAERIRLTTKSSDRWTCEQGLGVLRLDGLNKPAAPTTAKPTEFANWLAERAPHLVTATVKIPAEQLQSVLDAIEFAGVTDVEATVLPGPGSSDFLAERCVIQADPDVAGEWNVLHVTEAGHTEPVPGVTALKPSPRWVLTPTPALKKQAAEEAAEQADTELEAMDADLAAEQPVDPTPAEPAAPVEADVLGLDGRKRRELIQMCKDAGIASSGSISVLRARLAKHLASQTAGA